MWKLRIIEMRKNNAPLEMISTHWEVWGVWRLNAKWKFLSFVAAWPFFCISRRITPRGVVIGKNGKTHEQMCQSRLGFVCLCLPKKYSWLRPWHLHCCCPMSAHVYMHIYFYLCESTKRPFFQKKWIIISHCTFDLSRTSLYVKFIFSEKATKFCELTTLDLSYVCSNGQIYGGHFENICGLLRIYELYLKVRKNLHIFQKATKIIFWRQIPTHISV